MELKEMKSAFVTGGLSDVNISYTDKLEGYIISVQTRSGSTLSLTAQREGNGCPRSFKTIDSAISTVKKIGFKTVTISL